ncbi:MAG: NIPSNAP family protein [Pirellulaceae bacterium]
MKTISCCALTLFTSVFAGLSSVDGAETQPQYYEVRSYLLGEKTDQAVTDQYLQDALLPALQRAGIGPVGVFANAANDESGSSRIVVVIPMDSAAQVASVRQAVQADEQYRAAAATFERGGKADAPYQRITSELLVSMKCWPKLTVDAGDLQNADRVYELRLYESPNERLGNLKVDMFNNGEVPIFLDCGIKPIFIGQSILGPQTPNLTYLTMYPSDEARLKAWDAFRSHPDWKVLSKVAKYAGTVSKIDKYVLVPKSYSQM